VPPSTVATPARRRRAAPAADGVDDGTNPG
jgi:hypothetical protein